MKGREIPFLSFSAINNQLEQEILKELSDAWHSEHYILGPRVKRFEDAFGSYLGVDHVVGMNSGLDALIISLRALGVGAGDEVIIPSNTYIASVIAVLHMGATPVFCEPDERTYNINASGIEPHITERTKAILPVHLYGQSCEMETIMVLAANRNIFVVEDNAQAVGSSYNGKPTGSFGHINAQSFYPTKNLGALGDAGAISTGDATLAEECRALRNYGFKQQRYRSDVLAYNSRMDELQAGVLTVKLPHLEGWIAERQRLAGLYLEQLAGVNGLILPHTATGCSHTYHLFVVRTKQRDALQAYLQEQGVGTIVHYPQPPHLQPVCEQLGYNKGSLPVAEELADTSLSLPLYPGLTDDDISYVCELIHQFVHA